MEGELLWNGVYRLVRKIAKSFASDVPRRGRPDTYGVDTVVLCWLWSALRNRPLVHAVNELRSPQNRRWWRKGGFYLPGNIPHETTVRRRANRPDFKAFLQVLDQQLRRLLCPRTQRCLVDSTPLPLRRMSRDRDASWGFGKVYGYRWHTVTSSDRVILAGEVQPAHVHELTAAPRLVKQVAAQGIRARWLIGDKGYDSESLHKTVCEHLHGRLIAPFNRRRGARNTPRSPLRKWLLKHENTPEVQRCRRLRGEIDRMYGVLKSGKFGLYSVPPWVRHQPSIARWIELKKILYHADLLVTKTIN